MNATLTAHGLLLTETRRILDELSPKVARMARAEEVAAEVKKVLRDESRVRFTKWQQLAGLVAVATAIADTVSHFVN